MVWHTSAEICPQSTPYTIMRIQAVLVVFLSWSVITSSSAAQNSTPSDAENTTVLARTHFERGVEHYSEGNYDAALAELQRSYELSPTYKLLYNLAQVQMERHDYAAALGAFTDYLRLGGTAIAAERVSAVEQDLKRLKQRTAELNVDVDIPDAQIFVNAAPVGKSPLPGPIRVNVGSIAVRVEKAGYAPFERSSECGWERSAAHRRHVAAADGGSTHHHTRARGQDHD